jgi:hypothetical protein
MSRLREKLIDIESVAFEKRHQYQLRKLRTGIQHARTLFTAYERKLKAAERYNHLTVCIAYLICCALFIVGG